MSKNMTRKGLAFGAGLALVSSGLTGLPAQAAGLTGYIGLAPTSGPASAFAVTIGTDADFSLTAQAASNVAVGGVMKFLVTDPSGTVEPYIGGLTKAGSADEYPNSVATMAAADAAETTTVNADGSITFTTSNAFSAGDRVEFSVDVVEDQAFDILQDDTIYTIASVSGTTAFTLAAGSADALPTYALGTGNVDITSNVATLTVSNTLDVGDTFSIAAPITNSAGTILPIGTYTAAASTSSSVIKVAGLGGNIAQNAAVTGVTIQAVSHVADKVDNDVTVRKVRTGTTAANTYVVQTDINTVGAVALDLRNTSATTESTIEVVAWVDTFANNVIDSTEYVSATRTVKWIKAANLTAVTTLTAPNVGDETLVASITTTPMLNGAQLTNTNELRAVFTRADFANKLLANTDATQSATTGVWTSSIDLELTDASNVGNTLSSYTVDGDETAADWAGTPANVIPDVEMVGSNDTDITDGTTAANEINTISIATTKVVTVTMDAAHALSDGDLIDFTPGSTGEVAAITTTIGNDRPVTVTGDKTFTFVMDTTAAVAAATVTSDDVEADTTIDIVTYTTGDTTRQFFLNSRVKAGDYSATAYFNVVSGGTEKFNPLGAASALGTLSVSAADVILTTTGTASVQAIRENDATNDSVTDLLLKTGTTSATVVATVVDALGAAVGAGRSVSVTPSGATAGKGILVSGKSATAALLTTDANGQVEISIASTAGTNGEIVDITVVAEGQAAATVVLEVAWANVALTMSDLNMTNSSIDVGTGQTGNNDEQRTILAGTSYAMNVLVADQWFTGAASADYRIKVTGGAVVDGFAALVDGKASVTISDDGTATDYNTVLTLQKKSAAGVFADTATVKTISTQTTTKPGVLLAADGSTSYGMDGSETADLSDAVAAKALVERDTRTSFVAQPAYANTVVVTGKVLNSGTKVGLGGAVVTVSGPSNVLFVNGSVETRGSITFVANETSGEFDVTLYSTTAQTDSVITVTSMGVSKTTKVSFTGIGVGEGTSLVVTTPAAVKPASTFQVKAKLADAYGNGVNAGATAIKVTYTGPGIVFGTLPTTTDANGELQFAVLLGSNDTGTITVTVSYDQNGDLDYVDTKDLVTTATTVINATGVVASAGLQAGEVVNVGTFNGKIVVYAKGMKGETITWKIAGKWVKVNVTKDYQLFDRLTAAIGLNVNVDVHRAGNKTPLLSKTVLTK